MPFGYYALPVVDKASLPHHQPEKSGLKPALPSPKEDTR